MEQIIPDVPYEEKKPGSYIVKEDGTREINKNDDAMKEKENSAVEEMIKEDIEEKAAELKEKFPGAFKKEIKKNNEV